MFRLRPSIALLVLGALLLVGGARDLLAENERVARGRAVAEWPHVEGEVIYSGVDRSAEPVQARLAFWPFADTTTRHRAVVRYRYAVGGTPYLSDRLALGDARGYPDAAQALSEAARYPRGADVTVRFDPVRPGSAVLREEARRSLWRLARGAALLLMGLACGGILWRRHARGRNSR